MLSPLPPGPALTAAPAPTRSQQEIRPKQPIDKNTRGALSSKSNESNVDLVVFGHEQDGVGVDAGEHWEMDQRDWLGFKKRVGGMDANNAVVDAVVFGHDQDGFTSIKALEEQMKTLPQFAGAAGVCSSEVSSSNVMQVSDGAPREGPRPGSRACPGAA